MRCTPSQCTLPFRRIRRNLCTTLGTLKHGDYSLSNKRQYSDANKIHRTSWRENSTAMLTGYLSEWAILESSTANQKFNASDGCPLPVNRLWPKLARWYGISDSDVGRPETDERKYTVVSGAAKTLLGYSPPTTAKFSFTLSEWATRPENAKA
jgi:hypothetical protein